MRERPSAAFREFARAVIDAGADVFWGHSAHVVQGLEVHHGRPILYDTGDFVDDYMIDPALRNDLAALFVLHVVGGRVDRVELVPTRIDDMRVGLARDADRERFEWRFKALSYELGTVVTRRDNRLVVSLHRTAKARTAAVS